MMAKITKTYSVDSDIYEKFDRISNSKNLNKSNFLETKIKEYINDNVDINFDNEYFYNSIGEVDENLRIINKSIINNDLYLNLSDGNVLKYDIFDKICSIATKKVNPEEFFINENVNENTEIINPDNFFNYDAKSLFKEIEIDEHISPSDVHFPSTKYYTLSSNKFEISLDINEIKTIYIKRTYNKFIFGIYNFGSDIEININDDGVQILNLTKNIEIDHNNGILYIKNIGNNKCSLKIREFFDFRYKNNFAYNKNIEIEPLNYNDNEILFPSYDKKTITPLNLSKKYNITDRIETINGNVYLLDGSFWTTEEYLNKYFKVGKDYNLELNFDIMIKLSENVLKLKFRDYQKECLIKLLENRYTFINSSRQTGINKIILYKLLTDVLTNKDKTYLIIANTIEQLELIKSFFDMYYQITIKDKNSLIDKSYNEFRFSNNVKMIFSNSIDGNIKNSTDIIIINDEKIDISNILKISPMVENITIHINGKIINNDYKNIYENKENIFTKLKYHYSLVEGRDLNWKNNLISEITEEVFNKQYEI